ncbi:MAG: response regulator receiver [Gammaproteobacteria bacterium]|nr:MAG: response regulator receiver [Gammaproteobacteria bacterium]TND02443.1 MAG: response regulator receiver [Gammaproteobacteria bacterium]
MYNIMLVDDEQNILSALRRVLAKQRDWEVEVYSSAKEALRRATTKNFDLFLSDFRMPEMDGVQFLTEVKALQPEAMRLILSGYTDLQALMDAINKANIYRFVTKPWNDFDLVTVIRQALEYRDVLVENRRLADRVREQGEELDRRKLALERLKVEHPALVEVNWGPDGSIVVNEDDY